MSTIDSLHDEDGKPTEPTLIGKLREIVEDITLAKKHNDKLQSSFVVGTIQWHACETIDDHLHDALSKLGD